MISYKDRVTNEEVMSRREHLEPLLITAEKNNPKIYRAHNENGKHITSNNYGKLEGK